MSAYRYTIQDALLEARTTLSGPATKFVLSGPEMRAMEKVILGKLRPNTALIDIDGLWIQRVRQSLAMEDLDLAKTLTSGLHKFYRRQVAFGHISASANPMNGQRQLIRPVSKLITARQRDLRLLDMPTFEELELMLTAPNDLGGKALKTFIHSGVRPGELRALQGVHVIRYDPDEDETENPGASPGTTVLDIKQAFKKRKSEHDTITKWGPLGRPKSQAGVRMIPFDGESLDLVPEKLDPMGFVFSIKDGEPMYELALRNEFYKAQVALGIGSARQDNNHSWRFTGVFSPRALRHGFVARQIYFGESDDRIRRWAGHREISTTMGIYAYLFDTIVPGRRGWEVAQRCI